MRHSFWASSLVLFGLSLLAPSAATATQTVQIRLGSGDASSLEIHGEERVVGRILSDFPVDAEGTRLGQSAVLEHRLRAGIHLVSGNFKVGTEWDILSGQLVGDFWDIPGAVDERHRQIASAISPFGFVPRRAALTYSADNLVIEAGLVTSHWGLGLVANSGADDPLFGLSEFGDRVARVRSTWKGSVPGGALFVTAAMDAVIGDDVGRLEAGQQAIQALASVLYVGKGSRMGLYTAYRHQTELLTARQTDALVVDGYMDRTRALGSKGHRLRLAVEGAFIYGETDRSLSYSERGALEILSGGAAAVATLSMPDDLLRVHLRAGWSSGDNDSNDGRSSAFSMDRNFGAGMVLFDQVLGSVDAAAHVLVSDPERSGQPPAGIDALVGEGAVRGAAFLQPAIQVAPKPWLEFRAGVLLATATAPFAHPFYSHRAGGVARNHLNVVPEGRMLGTEIDWGLRLGGDLPVGAGDKLRLEVSVQGGHLLFGEALLGGEESMAHQLLLAGRFCW